MIRNARLDDVPAIRELINGYAELGKMLFRSLANLYENVRDFKVCEMNGEIVGCCALQIIWGDLAEIKSLAVREDYQAKGIGRALVEAVFQEARQLHLPRVFTLTLAEDFFTHLKFTRISRDSLPHKVWTECVHCPKQDRCDEIAMEYRLATEPDIN